MNSQVEAKEHESFYEAIFLYKELWKAIGFSSEAVQDLRAQMTQRTSKRSLACKTTV